MIEKKSQKSWQPGQGIAVAGALVGALTLAFGLASCGPERAYAPQIHEIGEKSPPPPRTGGNVPGPVLPATAPVLPATAPALPATAPGDLPQLTPVTPAAPPAVPAGTAVSTPAVVGSEYGFLDPLALKIAESLSSQKAAAVVLPPFHLNALFHRFEVSQLGEDLANELARRVKQASGGRAEVLAPEQFKIQLKSTNRSLGDLDSAEAALPLAARMGIRYLARGFIKETPESLTIQFEGVDVSDASPWAAPVQKTVTRGEPGSGAFFGRFKDSSGQTLLSAAFRIGALAEPEKPSLQRELQWIFSQVVEGLMVEGGAGLKEGPLAVLPTQVPSQISFQRQTLALRRAIADETERLKKLGFDEAKALGEGPVRILGKNYAKLRDAADAGREMEAANSLSETGELRSTLSRLIFDRAESLGEKLGIEVIPHDQLVNEVSTFSREEIDKIKDGVLDEKTKELFKTKGAKNLLFNELIESGDAFEFVFQIRRLDNLKKATSQLRAYLEPRFAVEMKQYVKK